jgi:hypothetical protein
MGIRVTWFSHNLGHEHGSSILHMNVEVSHNHISKCLHMNLIDHVWALASHEENDERSILSHLFVNYELRFFHFSCMPNFLICSDVINFVKHLIETFVFYISMCQFRENMMRKHLKMSRLGENVSGRWAT